MASRREEGAFVDDGGQMVKPETPNAVKLEQFVFDAIPLAANPLVYTTDRAEEFSPVKNAHGHDSPATSRRDRSVVTPAGCSRPASTCR